jgi:hypothetical protein
MFGKLRTSIPALLPATRGAIDAVLETRGPLVPERPEDGSAYGGSTYGWQAERVAFDPSGTIAARQRLPFDGETRVLQAAEIDSGLAFLSAKRLDDSVTLTKLRANGGHERIPLLKGMSALLRYAAGGTWVIECDCTWVHTALSGTWRARKLDGAGMQIALTGRLGPLGAQLPHWMSIFVRGDRAAAVGVATDPATGNRTSFTVLARLSSVSPSIDLGRLRHLHRRGLARECHGMPRKRRDIESELWARHDAELEACGVPPRSVIHAEVYKDGGLRDFRVNGATAEVTTCARRVLEAVFACPIVDRWCKTCLPEQVTHVGATVRASAPP